MFIINIHAFNTYYENTNVFTETILICSQVHWKKTAPLQTLVCGWACNGLKMRCLWAGFLLSLSGGKK